MHITVPTFSKIYSEMILNRHFEILFYLHNPEVSLIEVVVAKKLIYTGFPEVAWFALYKSDENIAQLKFKSALSRFKKNGRNIQEGVLKVSQSTGYHIITINDKKFEFTERPVENLPIPEEILLQAYLEREAS